MMRRIRLNHQLTVKEVAEKLDVSESTIYYLERHDTPPSIMMTMYMERLKLSEDAKNELRKQRKWNWSYDKDKTALTNELIRIRNGLGRSSLDLSRVIKKNDTYWVTIESESRQLSPDDLDKLDRRFRLSTTTLRRLDLAIEKDRAGEPMDEYYQNNNSEITEPYNLYCCSEMGGDREEFYKLLNDLENDYGGNITNVPESEPRLTELRKIMGVKYYDI